MKITSNIKESLKGFSIIKAMWHYAKRCLIPINSIPSPCRRSRSEWHHQSQRVFKARGRWDWALGSLCFIIPFPSVLSSPICVVTMFVGIISSWSWLAHQLCMQWTVTGSLTLLSARLPVCVITLKAIFWVTLWDVLVFASNSLIFFSLPFSCLVCFFYCLLYELSNDTVPATSKTVVY